MRDFLSKRVVSLEPSGIRKFFDIVSEMPAYNKSCTIYSCKCRSEIYTARERMSCRYRSYTDPAYGNGTACGNDRKITSCREII